MFRLFVSIIAAAILTACASPGAHVADGKVSTHEMLSGETLFGESISTRGIPNPRLFDIDDDMRAFVRNQIGDARSERERLRRLLAGMVESGLMSVDYDDVATKTARDTFHDRIGNCISFTTLFVALGREAGLDVTVQTVKIPPIWYSDSDLVVLNNHVNALVEPKFDDRYVVDFNVTQFKGNYDTQHVDDDYVLALYFNNIAMEALRRGETRNAFRLLKKSIQVDSAIPEAWSNLGVIYSRNEEPRLAKAAYQRALQIDPDNRSATTNLAALYRSLGDDEQADFYTRKVRNYRKQNPYYHYYTALAAYNDGRTDDAAESLKVAMRLKDNEHQFYQLEGLIHIRMGRLDKALASFVTARDLAGFGDSKRVYSNKIELLSSYATAASGVQQP